jgi:exonuclease 3'-5' domain-containing protein 1
LYTFAIVRVATVKSEHCEPWHITAWRNRRLRGRRFKVNGIKKCIESDAPLNRQKKQAWTAAKLKGEKLWNPEKGGSYKVLDVRPLSKDLFEYCIQDVVLLPTLRSIYWRKLSGGWKEKVEKVSMDWARESQRPEYNPQGPNRSLGP